MIMLMIMIMITIVIMNHDHDRDHDHNVDVGHDHDHALGETTPTPRTPAPTPHHTPHSYRQMPGVYVFIESATMQGLRIMTRSAPKDKGCTRLDEKTWPNCIESRRSHGAFWRSLRFLY